MQKQMAFKLSRFTYVVGALILALFIILGIKTEHISAEDADMKKITIVHTNDIHAQMDDLDKLAAYNQKEKENADIFFYVDAGDIFSGNPVVDMNKGKPMIDLLNQVGLEVIGIGNHEFDYGAAELEQRVGEANFDFLSANTEVVASEFNQPEPYKIIEKDGVTFGFIALTQAPPATAPKNVEGIEFHDYEKTIEKYEHLQDEVDILIGVNHIGLEEDRKLAEEFDMFDVIIGGHSHTKLTNADIVNGTPIVQTGSHLNNIGNVTLTVDAEKNVTDFSWQIEEVDSLTEVDKNVQESIQTYNEEMEEELSEVIGETTGLSQSGKQARDVPLGNFWTDAMRDHVGADLAFTNNGGIRAPIEPGDLTYGDIYNIEPFANEIMEIDMTGEAIRNVLEYSFIRDDRFQIDLQASGINYTIYQDAFGELDHVEAMIDGEPMEDDKIYKAAVPDYIGSGGSGYNFEGDVITSSAGLMTEAMINYAEKLVETEGIIDVKEEGRISIKKDVLDNVSVAEAIANNEGRASVTGYVVGHVVSPSNYNLEAPFGNDQNLLLADDPEETDSDKMLPVQLTKEHRDQFGLASNPDRIGEEVTVTGSLEEYYTKPGLKNPERIVKNNTISIADARQLDEGDTATIEGVVLVDSGAWGAESFYMHDGTGGISVYQFDTKLEEGDYVRVTGKLDNFNGEIQFSDVSTIDVLDADQPLPDVLNVTIEELDQSFIGELVQLKGATITEIGESDDFGTFEFQVTIDTNERSENNETLQIRVDSRTGFGFEDFDFVKGDELDITGIVGIFHDTLQIKPRKASDIVEAEEPTDPEDGEDGEDGEGGEDGEDGEDGEGGEDTDNNNANDQTETDDLTGSDDSKKQDGEKLPDTATNTWNVMLIGLALLMVGSTVLFIVKGKRKNKYI